MSNIDGWFAPLPRSEGMAANTALVLVSDPRAAVAATLILQEMGYTVDLGSEPGYALRWLRRARYDVILAAGPAVSTVGFASRLREAASDARVLVLADRRLREGDLGAMGIELLPLPVDVNALVACLQPPA